LLAGVVPGIVALGGGRSARTRTQNSVATCQWDAQERKRERERNPREGSRWTVLELCPRGNNKDVIIIIIVHDNVYIPW
jgi:hypothetical protein